MDRALDAGQIAVPWLTVLGLVVTGVRLLMAGALVPRRQVDAMTEQWQARLDESHAREQDWRAAYQAGAATNAEWSAQVEQMLIAARATEALIRALPTGRTP
jgi:hypothetical protein